MVHRFAILFASLLGVLVFVAQGACAEADVRAGQGAGAGLPLSAVVREAVARNPSAMTDFLQARMSREQIQVEEGVFDPVFQSSLLAKRIRVQNGVEDAINRKEASYTDNADSLEVGLNGLLPYGTQWDVKFNQVKRSSSTIDKYAFYNHEYDNSLKLSLTQPILKGFGSKSTMARIGMAELQSTIDADKFRQKLMELVGVTVQVYWKLYGSQQLLQSWEKSIRIAEEAVDDLGARAKAGKIAQTEYLENVSAVNIRKAELYNARSRSDEARNQLLTLLNASASEAGTGHLVASDNPFAPQEQFRTAESYVASALEQWPEYRVAKNKLEKEKIQLEYLKNQALPQLDVIGSFGSTSLDSNYDRSFRYVTDGGYLNWSAGLKFSLPLDNLTADSNLRVARMRVQQAEVEVESYAKSYGNSIYSKVSEVLSYRSQLRDLESGLQIKADLLEIERSRLKAGRINLKALLERQDDFISYQRRVLSTVVNYKTAEAALDIAVGGILQKYGIDPDALSYGDDALSGRMGPLFGGRLP